MLQKWLPVQAKYRKEDLAETKEREKKTEKKKKESVGDLVLISTIYLSNTNAYINSNLNHFSEF